MSKEAEMIKLVLMRLETMPDYIKVHLGGTSGLEKKDLIAHVKKQDELGKQIVKMQMAYLRSLKQGM